MVLSLLVGVKSIDFNSVRGIIRHTQEEINNKRRNKMTKTEQKIIDKIKNGNTFTAFGRRAANAARKLRQNGIITAEQMKVTSSYAPAERLGCSGSTLWEVAVYAK